VIFPVSDNDPRKCNLALNNVKNVKRDSEVANRVADALARGVNILACENTMTNTKTTRAGGVRQIRIRRRDGCAGFAARVQGSSLLHPLKCV
jgi:intracellular sulfur oxidation DsrE/DsrF family protein